MLRGTLLKNTEIGKGKYMQEMEDMHWRFKMGLQRNLRLGLAIFMPQYSKGFNGGHLDCSFGGIVQLQEDRNSLYLIDEFVDRFKFYLDGSRMGLC